MPREVSTKGNKRRKLELKIKDPDEAERRRIHNLVKERERRARIKQAKANGASTAPESSVADARNEGNAGTVGNAGTGDVVTEGDDVTATAIAAVMEQAVVPFMSTWPTVAKAVAAIRSACSETLSAIHSASAAVAEEVAVIRSAGADTIAAIHSAGAAVAEEVAAIRSAGADTIAAIHSAGAAVVTKNPCLHALVMLTGTDYFSQTGCVFSDPSGIGAALPKVVVELLSAKMILDYRDQLTIEPDQVEATTYNHLRVFPPETIDGDQQPCIMNYLLYRFGDYLGGRETEIASGDYGSIENDSGKYTGLRMINGLRIEIFMNDPDRTQSCILTLIKDMLTELAGEKGYANSQSPAKKAFIPVQVNVCFEGYCNHLAMRDDRIRLSNPPYIFQNHAIIASYGVVEPQDVHIDLDDARQYQFGVLLTPDSAPTYEYKAEDPVMKQFDPLSTIWKDMPIGLNDLLLANEATRKEVDSYGSLLSTHVRVGMGGEDLQQVDEDDEEDDLFPVGTLMSMPGRVAHGGPKATRFRAVLFFTGAPDEEECYDADKQANRTTLIGNMLYESFVVMSHEQRVYLLDKWYTEGLSKDRFGVTNLKHKPLIELGLYLKRTPPMTPKREAVIKGFVCHDWNEVNWASATSIDWYKGVPKPPTTKKKKKT